MTRYVTIPVTSEIISHAIPESCYRCLIALALRKATQLDWHVMKDDAAIMTMTGRKPVWGLPDDVFLLRRRFEAGETIAPTTFRLPARFADHARWAAEGAGLPEDAI